MPAQKLTKARLAQIIIMLSILVVAFFWRTLTYEANEQVICQSEKVCKIKSLKSNVTLIKSVTGISVQNPEKQKIRINLNRGSSHIDTKKTHTLIPWEDINSDKIVTISVDDVSVNVIL
ncbi:hypothetical protein BS333_06865 [Vibrio azureus]|uniref:Uncharacterized protein n=1 Tax=Vibrio azureus NBRC 104587 TaxID=1219077 RepID=U3C828_9VIBR|nr:hypothetical protein [Vibrio azureus]AUI86129.1 hypothetical protein BS333_06865 [Vibrio azureus]GAD74608.1 hypothetical protein VAZ01S_013_00150 [Vibrio azureus NBRC 104587]